MNAIKINVSNSVLTAKADFPLASGAVDTVVFDAAFDASWDGYDIKLVFSYQGAYPPEVREVLYRGGTQEVPWEVLAYPGELMINAVGVSGGKVFPTAHMREPLRIHYSGPISGSESKEHTAELWQYGLGEVLKAKTAAETARDDAKTAAADAAGSKSAAETARQLAEKAEEGAVSAGNEAEAAKSQAKKSADEALAARNAAQNAEETASISASSAEEARASAWEAAGRAEKGDPAVLLSSKEEYKVGISGENPPDGAWLAVRPDVQQGQWLWTRVTQVFNTGDPVVWETPTYIPHDGSGSVESVNGIYPDETGDVRLTAETVGAVSVDRTVNGKELDKDIKLTAQDVGALSTDGGEMAGPINMQQHTVSGIPEPETGDQAANKSYVDDAMEQAVSTAGAAAQKLIKPKFYYVYNIATVKNGFEIPDTGYYHCAITGNTVILSCKLIVPKDITTSAWYDALELVNIPLCFTTISSYIVASHTNVLSSQVQFNGTLLKVFLTSSEAGKTIYINTVAAIKPD